MTEQIEALRLQLEGELEKVAQFPHYNPGPVLRLDTSGVVILANRAATALLGDDVIDRCWLDVCPGIDDTSWAAASSAVDTPFSVEADIGERCFTFQHVRVPDDDLVFVFGTDITERRLAEASLREVARFPDMNPGPVLRTDSSATVLLSNAAAREAFGGDLVGRSWREVCSSIDEEFWERVTSTTDVVPAEVTVDEHCYLFSHRYDPATRLVFVFGTDITERRRAEASLREVARFPDMNPGPVVRTDSTSAVLLSNVAARDVFGGDLVGRSWRQICPGVDDEFWERVLSTTDVVPLEATVDGCIYLFSHRHDPRSRLVFVFGTDITQHKMTERALVQSEKMATLGTLAAGVAHELNNPAAAARRAAEQLADALQRVDAAHVALNELHLDAATLALLRDLEDRARIAIATGVELSGMDRADSEGEIEDWLDSHGVPDGWDLAAALCTIDLGPERLEEIAAQVAPEALGPIVTFAARTVPVYSLAREIGESSSRISDIVNALRGYSFLGQAPSQDVDVHQGIEDTLVILNSKIGEGVVIRREYDTSIPLLAGYGGELNQVWTHLIDNGLDAVDGNGTITITTRASDGAVEVEVADSGPGMPPDVAARVFDPFFTTKPQGKGTGLGLSTSHSIVADQHGGAIHVSSAPGDTRFTVRLPISSAHVSTSAAEDGSEQSP